MIAQIKQKIEQHLPGAKVTVIDQSAAHQGHGASGAHLEMEVIYPGFASRTMLEQHQTIYKILDQELKQQIHALKLTTRAT